LFFFLFAMLFKCNRQIYTQTPILQYAGR
jgi:hypothetical protein